MLLKEIGRSPRLLPRYTSVHFYKLIKPIIESDIKNYIAKTLLKS